MGMPGSETALKEVMCRVLGPLLQDGSVAKITDDLYCGGNTPQELLHNWKRVLQALHKSNLRLSAHKTIISAKTTTTKHVSGFFSAKLWGSQTTWLPCEVEALSTAAATKHFSPYLIQSVKKACIHTDSKPCVQAYEKLCRGEFSASPRVSTFLSVVSRYQASVRHVSGAAILPSDFASRNAATCEKETCQVCSFISRTRDSVVRAVSGQDILQGNVRLSFTSRPA